MISKKSFGLKQSDRVRLFARLRPRRSLGQNFLKSSGIAAALVAAADIKQADTVVEVGPGKGIITEILLQTAKKVIAVEKDFRMIALLKEKFSQEIADKKLALVHNDILNFNPNNLQFEICNFKLVGSIPYYITGMFLKYFLQETAAQPSAIALIIQREVAKRIAAKNKKESILSISVKAYGTPRYIKTISRKLFSPEPNVDSAIIVIENISRNFFSDISEELFFKLLRAGFSSKRKKLLSNIKKQFPKMGWESVFSDANISPNIRAENLTLEQWQLLCKKLSVEV